jgi:Chaperone of endosialidase
MTSSFTTGKGHLEKPANGDYPGSWNTPVNTDWDGIDALVSGTTSVSTTGGTTNLSQSQMQVARILITGTLASAATVNFLNSVPGQFIIDNRTTGAYTVTIGVASGSGTVTVPQGGRAFVFSDGTGVVFADDGQFVQVTGSTMTGSLNLPSNGLNVGSGQLQVTGGNVTASGSITAAGNITAYSDARLKDDIKTITNALEMVKQMRGVRYTVASTGMPGVGVVAQEVQNVIPEVVFHDDAGLLHVAYQNIVGVLINAIKELNHKVDRLEARK